MKRFYYEKEMVERESFYVPLYKRASTVDVISIGYGLFVVAYLVIFYVISLTNSFIRDPMQVDIGSMFLPTSFEHLFGTDFLGRDIFSRIVKGTEAFFLPGLLCIAVSTTLGLGFGILSGYYPRYLSKVIFYLLNIIDSIPRIIIILIIIIIFNPSIYVIMVFVGITSVPKTASYIKAKVEVLKEQRFIEACRALGLSQRTIIFKHIIWLYSKSILIIQATLRMGESVLMETSLSYLGIGVQEPIPSWGNMVAMGKDFFFQGKIWLSTIPAVIILMTIMGFYLLGDGLNSLYNEKVSR
ncbi:MAG TPA: ABC transporter permease [Spirochaetota bacterium]|nr:ABC transporter permease [Spirochaetota bacterium]